MKVRSPPMQRESLCIVVELDGFFLHRFSSSSPSGKVMQLSLMGRVCILYGYIILFSFYMASFYTRYVFFHSLVVSLLRACTLIITNNKINANNAIA